MNKRLKLFLAGVLLIMLIFQVISLIYLFTQDKTYHIYGKNNRDITYMVCKDWINQDKPAEYRYNGRLIADFILNNSCNYENLNNLGYKIKNDLG